jgi:eukaryotic-like serine/threonine-protein kinase
VSDDGLVPDLAGAILDGGPIDWNTAEASASDNERTLLLSLRRLAALADFHRGVPLHWGHLRLIEIIGRGAYADVYRAWDTRLDREVALKLLTAAAPTGDAAATTIIEEGRLLARVDHPNVVTIYGADRIDDRVGLWMEFLKGRTLEQLLQQDHVFELPEVVGIAADLCRAIAAVHDAGLLHRDVKAHNAMMDDTGRVVLMDFGAGRELGDGGPDVAGTPLYLAPEVFLGQPATVQSDIYSLGVLLYHLLTGSYPVQAATLDDLRRAHEAHARPDLSRLGGSARFAQIVARTLEPAAARRYRSVHALSADLDRMTRASVRSQWLRRSAAAAAVVVVSAWGAWAAGWLSTGHLPGPLASSVAALGISAPTVLPQGERPVVAVAPLRNRTGRPDDDLLVEGLRYEVVRSLAQLEGLNVRSATSPADSDVAADPQAFGRSVGANLVLAGSVFRSPGGLRLRAELIRVADNTVVLPVSVESATADALALQDELSLAVVNRLRLQGLGTRRYRLDPRLSATFLTARALQARRNTDNAGKAAQLFEQILAAEPDFAPAHAGLASALGAFSLATPGTDAPPPDPRMRSFALRAIKLDPFLAEAHSAMGSLYARDRDWNNARASFLKALELEPTLTTAHSEFVLSVLLPLGRLDEARRVMDDAVRADPLSLDVRRITALVQVESRLYDQAIANARWVLQRDPMFPYAETWLARALLLSGRVKEAEPLYANKHWSYRGYLYAVTGRQEQAEALAAAHPEDPVGRMFIYGGLNDTDRAFAELERAFERHWWRAATWGRRVEVAALRDDPRTVALRQRVGMPD